MTREVCLPIAKELSTAFLATNTAAYIKYDMMILYDEYIYTFVWAY